MNKIKYDINLMKYMELFENITNTKLKDCIENDKQLIFVVEGNEIGKAIGKNGVNARKVESVLNRNIKIVEFSPDAKQFITNFVYPLQLNGVEEDSGRITIHGPDTKTKGLLIGRDSRNLKSLLSIVKRYFDVADIRVI